MYFPFPIGIFDYLGAVFICEFHIEAQFAFCEIDGLNVIHVKNIGIVPSEKSEHISMFIIAM